MMKNCQRGMGMVETAISVVFVFVLVALIINISSPDTVRKYLGDLKLSFFIRRVANEAKNYSLDGKVPTCQQVVGIPPDCSKLVLENVRTCACPYFTLNGIDTGSDPYAGFKYVYLDQRSFCLSVVANNPEKGKYYKINYPLDTDPKRSNKGC